MGQYQKYCLKVEVQVLKKLIKGTNIRIIYEHFMQNMIFFKNFNDIVEELKIEFPLQIVILRPISVALQSEKSLFLDHTVNILRSKILKRVIKLKRSRSTLRTFNVHIFNQIAF